MKKRLSIIFFGLIGLLILPNSNFVSAQDPLPSCNTTNLSDWEQYVCGIVNRPTNQVIDPGCYPRSFTALGSSPRGIIAIFHGFTACPDSMQPLAQSLQNQGFHVYTFLSPGHGREFNTTCSDSGVECISGDPIEELPTTELPYATFIGDAVSILREEFGLRGLSPGSLVGATGLSLGGAIAHQALVQAPDFFTHGLLMNPFFGITIPSADTAISACSDPTIFSACVENFTDFALETLLMQFADLQNPNATFNITMPLRDTVRDLLLQAITTISPTPNVLQGGFAELQNLLRFALVEYLQNPAIFGQQLSGLLTSPFSWGDQCEVQRSNGRLGFCNFQFQHLLAAHALGQRTLAQSAQVRVPNLQIVTVQRDGVTRSALAWQVLQTATFFGTPLVGACQFLVTRPPCNGTNDCGVPHSFLSRPENTATPPGILYWENALFSGVGRFFSQNDTYGSISSPPGRSDCVELPIFSPPINSVGPVPRGATLTLQLSFVPDLLFLNNVRNEISDAIGTGISWRINFLRSLLGSEASMINEDGTLALRMEWIEILDAQTFRDQVVDGFASLVGVDVISFQIDGEQAVGSASRLAFGSLLVFVLSLSLF